MNHEEVPPTAADEFVDGVRVPATGATHLLGRGTNSVQVRHYNQRVVLDAIRRLGEASKAEIARHARLTPPAISGIVDDLVASGYLVPRGKRAGARGQPSSLYGLDPEGGFSLGLHLGRRSLDAVLVDFAGQVVATETHDYDFPEPAHVASIGDGALKRLRGSLGPRAERLVGLGISAPYFLGGWERELGFPLAVSAAWREADLTTLFAEARGLPLFVENDASASAAAELVFGAGRQFRDFVHLSIATMIGGGLVLDGVLQTGPNGNAAAFGPMPVAPSRLSSVPPPSGAFEVLLRRASVYGLLNHLAAGGHDVRRARDLEALPPAAMPLVREWQEDCADALAQALVATVAVVDVEAVVIDGLLPRSLLADTVDLVALRFAAMLPQGLVAPLIHVGVIGPQASALGAAILPIYLQFAPDSAVLTRKAQGKKPQMIGFIQ